MLHIYRKCGSPIEELQECSSERGLWYCLVNPTNEELSEVQKVTGVPVDILGPALDEEERPRVEVEEAWILIIVNIPLMKDEDNFDTIPLGIIITRDHFITVTIKHTEILSFFASDKDINLDTMKRTRFLFKILYKTAEMYLKHLAFINRHTDRIEQTLRQSMKNKDLFRLFQLSRSLVYFTGSLKDNGVVMKKLMRYMKMAQFQHLLKMYEEDEDLLEDVIIENEQALDMVEMHSNILNGLMNAFASIISNNVNIVMKFLTTITIILAVPTMIASFWGMNVKVPWLVGQNEWGFFYVAILAVVITSVIAFFLLKKEEI